MSDVTNQLNLPDNVVQKLRDMLADGGQITTICVRQDDGIRVVLNPFGVDDTASAHQVQSSDVVVPYVGMTVWDKRRGMFHTIKRLSSMQNWVILDYPSDGAGICCKITGGKDPVYNHFPVVEYDI